MTPRISTRVAKSPSSHRSPSPFLLVLALSHDASLRWHTQMSALQQRRLCCRTGASTRPTNTQLAIAHAPAVARLDYGTRAQGTSPVLFSLPPPRSDLLLALSQGKLALSDMQRTPLRLPVYLPPEDAHILHLIIFSTFDPVWPQGRERGRNKLTAKQ